VLHLWALLVRMIPAGSYREFHPADPDACPLSGQSTGGAGTIGPSEVPRTTPDRSPPSPALAVTGTADGTGVVLAAGYLVRSVTRRYAPAVNLQLCYSDAYARAVEARVVAVDALDAPLVVLDQTVFYPGGGGQPPDRGILLRGADGRTWAVRAARKSGGEIAHELEAGVEPPAVGDLIRVDLDWARRYALMRTHSALHALCGVVWRDYGAQVTGGNMEPGLGRMDFEFERMTGDLVDEIEAKVNAELAAGREIRVAVLPREEAFAIPDLIRTKVNLLPPGIEEIRTIEIVGLDLQADGGTHVANTREVGGIKVTGYESKGRINKRIRIALVDA
jgi:misacylated tRNA(Ala) deacylase